MTLLLGLLIAAGAGMLVGLEAWAWMRHGKSAIGLVIGGTLSLGIALLAGLVAVMIAYSVLSAIIGWDPAGLGTLETSSQQAPDGSECDPNYADACLDPNAGDYDCAGGSGDGPQYSGLVTVTGDDVYDLDRDGDGTGCED